MYDLEKVKKLCEEGLSNEKIAKILGVGSADSVARFLKKNNITKHNRIVHLTGQRFGSLLVKEHIDTLRYKGGGTYHVYNCECDCGNNFSVRSCNLKNGNSTRCSKCKSEHLHYKNTKSKIPSYIKANARNRAKSRGREYNLDDSFLWNLFLKQDKRCAITGIELFFGLTAKDCKDTTASLDRIDNSKGYTEDNVRWVHKRINIMKLDLNDDEFIKWCSIVVNSIEKPDTDSFNSQDF